PYPAAGVRHHADSGSCELSIWPCRQVPIPGISAVSEAGPVLRTARGEDRRGSPLYRGRPASDRTGGCGSPRHAASGLDQSRSTVVRWDAADVGASEETDQCEIDGVRL